MTFAGNELTSDRFLDGRLTILQPRNGYRAGVDPVFLAASLPAKSGQTVLELGCGAGVASLCLARRVPGLELFGVELQAAYADLARRNAEANDIKFQVDNSDLRAIPEHLREKTFDHVFANPPYFQRHHGTSASDAGRDTALAGTTALEAWIGVAARRLKPGGFFTMIQRTDRLAGILRAMDDRLGSIVLQPLAPRNGRSAELIIVQARKSGKGALKLAAPIILHEGAHHERDGESYTPVISEVLRNGAALNVAR